MRRLASLLVAVSLVASACASDNSEPAYPELTEQGVADSWGNFFSIIHGYDNSFSGEYTLYPSEGNDVVVVSENGATIEKLEKDNGSISYRIEFDFDEAWTEVSLYHEGEKITIPIRVKLVHDLEWVLPSHTGYEQARSGSRVVLYDWPDREGGRTGERIFESFNIAGPNKILVTFDAQNDKGVYGPYRRGNALHWICFGGCDTAFGNQEDRALHSAILRIGTAVLLGDAVDWSKNVLESTEENPYEISIEALSNLDEVVNAYNLEVVNEVYNAFARKVLFNNPEYKALPGRGCTSFSEPCTEEQRNRKDEFWEEAKNQAREWLKQNNIRTSSLSNQRIVDALDLEKELTEIFKNIVFVIPVQVKAINGIELTGPMARERMPEPEEK